MAPRLGDTDDFATTEAVAVFTRITSAKFRLITCESAVDDSDIYRADPLGEAGRQSVERVMAMMIEVEAIGWTGNITKSA
ncbi:hypothetical protein J7F03_14365 [Streptomyces sp. ISL-43]|uniref:hypothetical protein n=1 Tax=Streptomyces sp. ISL-43 TaxID=2819183 RepID=UPI001BE80BCA|nr:hypothetical protein [Streptomyces sp. ISL-43]MBT2448241.1 hypothetical protein [Streptomyces sp. ISL-43]